VSDYLGPDHKVTVTTYTYRHLETDGTSTDVVEVDHDIEHPTECDALKYGESCALDEFIYSNGTEYSGLPMEAGVYVVSCWGTGPDYNGEYDAGLNVAKVTEPTEAGAGS